MRSDWHFQLKKDYRFLLTSLLPLGIRVCQVLRVRTPQGCSERSRVPAGADPGVPPRHPRARHGRGSLAALGGIPVPVAGQKCCSGQPYLEHSATGCLPRRVTALLCHHHTV